MWGTFLCGAVAGAALMYFLDPDRGGRRRALLRDKAVGLSNDVGEAATGAARDLRNRAQGVVVVTGGTTGIGRATARLLASRGARVLIFGRHEEELSEALEEMRGLGGVDVLINNAAVSAGSILEGDYSGWQYVVGTNLLGYMACTRYALDRMLPKGDGHILLVGSMSAYEREEGKDIYVATKAAIQGFTQALRKSVNKEGVRVTLVEPGKVASDMSGPKEEQPEKERKMEMLKAEDIVECVYHRLAQPKRCDVVSVQIRPLMQLI